MPTRIAFITSDQLPNGTDDDAGTIPLFETRGIQVTPAIWSDPAIDWTAFDLVVIRSPWDYFVRPAEFAAWMERIEAEGVRVMNPISVLRWNSDKRYLREMESAGVEMVPTRWLPRGEPADLRAILAEEGWEKAVVKPVISGGAFHTEKVTPETLAPAQALLDELLATRDMMVQRYMDEINAEGEWSLLFFNKKYSHAIIKRPARTDFRVQAHLGGTHEERVPSEALRATAASILARVDAPLLYARVDGVVHAGRFLLIELEILEPSLFMSGVEGARERFVDAVLEIL